MIATASLVAAPQIAGIDESLYFARWFSVAARMIEVDRELKRALTIVKFAFLNRACELACVNLHLYPVETAQDVEIAWYTYRPAADIDSGRSFHSPVMVGYESSMTEDQARSRAIGW